MTSNSCICIFWSRTISNILLGLVLYK